MKIGSANLAFPFSKASLTTRFAIHSFICIGIMASALWFIVSNYMISEILDREWQTTAKQVRSEVKQFLVAEDFTTKDRKSVGHKFAELLRHIQLMPDLVRFKVYNPDRVIIWSDDKRLVGKSFSDNEELEQAIKGNVAADMSSLDKKENEFEKNTVDRAVELYVPIFSENPNQLLGVFELYKNADSIYQGIRKARLAAMLGALGGGLLLYLSLFAIVRQAARKIDEQQENLIKMQSELIASQRMAAVGEMAAAVAHGIGNPLSSIRAAAQVATLDCKSESSGELGKKMEASLRSIMQQVDRVQKRMQALLNFAKPMEPRPGPVELNVLVRDITETLRVRFADAGVNATLDLDPALPTAMGDANHLEQVFMGLITNALEATPKGGTVTIRTRMSAAAGNGKGIHVFVEDTGEGIPVENRERVFEPFFTTKPFGTGIGLPLAKRFVERNGGSIEIADAPNAGTKIDVALPLSP